jgi:hypothetical protein
MHGQGTIRENLDPMRRHSDRELIGALKATRLWDILCGLSLSQAKGRHGGRRAPSAARPVPPRPLMHSSGGTAGSAPRESPGSSYGAPKTLRSECALAPSCSACMHGSGGLHFL